MHRSDSLLQEIYANRHDRVSPLWFLALLALIFIFIFSFFFGGEFVQRLYAYHKARQAIERAPEVGLYQPIADIVLNTIPELPLRWLREGLVESGLPVYDLRIAPKQLRRLQDTAEKVTAQGASFDTTRDYMTASFRLGDEWVPIEVKLRGITSQHYHKRAPSLRLKFPRDRLFNGKKQINLSFLYDKGLTADITTNWELSRYGILTWDSRFVVVRLNDEVVGLFQEIEQFGRSIWDRNRRSEGYIFAGHGQLFGNESWDYRKAATAIELVKQCNVLPDSPIAQHCDWEFFRDYFDIEKLAWAAALTVVLNSLHAWSADNIRLYWDPARGKFEPIPWDYSYYNLDPALHPEGEQPPFGYREAIYEIPEFRRLRDQRIWTIATERVEAMIEHANGLFEQLARPLAYDMRHPRLETDRSFHAGYIDSLRNNSKFLMDIFQRHDLRVYVWPDGPGRVILNMENFGKAFIEISDVVLSDGNGLSWHSLEFPLIVDGFWLGEPGSKQHAIAIPVGSRLIGVTAQNSVTGDSLDQSDIAIKQGGGGIVKLAPISKKESLKIVEDGIYIDQTTITFGPGLVELHQSLEIPPFYNVVFAPNLKLALGSGVSLIIHGDLESLGNDKSPVKVYGIDSRKDWGGVFVQGTRTRPSHVRIEHTNFDGGMGGESHRSFFTGTLSIHDGVVGIYASEFIDSTADDGINLKYSDVDLQNNLILGSQSDALDCDFCTGEVANNRIIGIGGDGLDFSGSDIIVDSNEISQCLDKGISIGERTYAIVTANVVSDCKMGIAVKDSSRAVISGGHLTNLEVGVGLYVKKLTFGPALAVVEGLHMNSVATSYLSDRTSTIDMHDSTVEMRKRIEQGYK